MKRITWAMLGLILLPLAACDDDEESTTVGLSLSSRAVVATLRAEGDLEITRARLVLEEIELETDDDGTGSSSSDGLLSEDDPNDDSSGFEYETGPTLLELNLSGEVNKVMVANVPAGLYDELEFEVDTVDDDEPEDRSAMSNPAFADFVGENRYSVIIEGRYDGGAGFEDFTFRSDLSATQEQPLVPPLVLEAGDGSANLTLVIDTTTWFQDGSGSSLDPSDPTNASQIENNIQASIDVFEDDDEDGYEDDD